MKNLSMLASRSLLISALALALAGAASAQFNSNLIVNGDAESGTGSASGNDVIAAPGWTTTGNATVIQYNTSNGGPTPTDPGPTNRGVNYFIGGPSNAASSLSQSIALSSGFTTIDSGFATYSLSGYLGGYLDQNDNSILTATFLNSAGASLGVASIGPVTASNRGNATGLLLRSGNGSVPAGTRSIGLLLSFTRTDGSYNDGNADNLSLVLRNANPTPEPMPLAAMAAGSIVLLRRRRSAR